MNTFAVERQSRSSLIAALFATDPEVVAFVDARLEKIAIGDQFRTACEIAYLRNEPNREAVVRVRKRADAILAFFVSDQKSST